MSDRSGCLGDLLGKWKEYFYDVDIVLMNNARTQSIKAVLALHSPFFQALIRFIIR